MIKRFSTLALVALLALPAAAGATASPADLEAQIARLTQELSALKQQMAEIKESTASTDDKVESINEKSEKWDESSRIQLSGDFRTRLDYVSADTPSAYTALNVGQGVSDFIDLGGKNGLLKPNLVTGLTPLANFGLTPASPIGNPAAPAPGSLLSNLGPALAGGQAAFVGAATGAGLTPQQATDMYALFSNPQAQALVGAMGAQGATVGQLLGGLSSAKNLTSIMKKLSPAARRTVFGNMFNQYQPTKATDYTNDTMWTNRLRVNMRAKATEDVEFKARLAMYKAWGMENNPVDYTANAGMGGGAFMLNSLSFDGNSTRQPSDDALRVDRAFMNWNNIGGTSTWFSIGRRPTTDGPPAQFRMGVDERLATPVAYMDYPFDGLSIGYAYNSLFGVEDFPGRIRFCYGRGFESGPTDNGDGLKDTDFAGLSWDVYSKGNQFFNIQSFVAANMFNVPDNVKFVNPVEFGEWQHDPSFYNPTVASNNLILDRKNLGDIYHTDAVYYDKYQNLNYFLTGGWSRTKANGVDELGTSLLGSWWDDPTDKDGFSVYTGVRYDIPESPFKVGLEYNYGTKNWISFTPGNDDLYASKLATRGHVVEAYGIWNIPAGEAISKFGKAFMRLGVQHYQYNYTGSGFWLGEPMNIDDLKKDPLAAQFYTPVDSMNEVYATIEAWF
jgi:hypothetical protein